jgi:S-methylmethionine-dependent homocysteine/selenocysteine methylase
MERVGDTWLRRLEAGRTLLLDGGTGSELRRRGMPLSRATWSALASLTHYDLLRAIHSDYIDAGADVITTNTFATTRFVLQAAGHGDDFTLINTRAVAAAREARDIGGREVAIAGSISCLPPRFDAHAYPDESTERAAYVELAETLAEAGVDLLALEMLQEARHAPLVYEAARAVGLPIWLGVSCRLGADATLVGFDFPLVPLAECLEALLAFAPAAVNVMHSPMTAIEPGLREVRARWPGPLGAYPEIGDGTPHAPHSVSPDSLAAEACGWLANGAQIIGGCCGATPEHVRALAKLPRSVSPAALSG